MTKKGFTIIELLASITIIAIISTAGVISYTKFMDASAEKVFTEYQDAMYAAASNYVLKNYTKPGGMKTTLTIDELKVDTIKNPRDNSQDCKANSYVKIEKNESCQIKSYKYEVCLNCGEYFNNCRRYYDKNCS